MLSRKIRNLAVTAITIVSATVLTTLSATGASATTLPTCYKNGTLIPWTCVQVIGSGLHIAEMDGWLYNPKDSIYTGASVDIELYYAGRNQAPGIDTPKIRNCDQFYVPEPGFDSDPCPWQPIGDVNAGYYCAALWWFQNIPPNIWTLLGWRCVYVRP
jgi:hypothetical protein